MYSASGFVNPLTALDTLKDYVDKCTSFSQLESEIQPFKSSTTRISLEDMESVLNRDFDFNDFERWPYILDDLATILNTEPKDACTTIAYFKHKYLGLSTSMSSQLKSDTIISIAKQYQTCLVQFIKSQSDILLSHLKGLDFNILGIEEKYSPLEDCIKGINPELLAPLGSIPLVDWQSSLFATAFFPIINEPNCTFIITPSNKILEIQSLLFSTINSIILEELKAGKNNSLVYLNDTFTLRARKQFLTHVFNDTFTCEILPEVLSIFDGDSTEEVSRELHKFAYGDTLMNRLFSHDYPIHGYFYLFPTLSSMISCVDYLRNNIKYNKYINVHDSSDTIAKSARNRIGVLVTDAKNRPEVYSVGSKKSGTSCASITSVSSCIFIGCFIIISNCF